MKLDWDSHSDQPHVIKDKALKKHIYKKYRWDFFKLFVTNLVIYPLVILVYRFFPTRKIQVDTNLFFGMSINQDKNPFQSKGLIDDLGVKTLLIRMPLSDIEHIDKYVDFAAQYDDKDILINILQDRRHIENKDLLTKSLEHIFSAFSPYTTKFQLGNAINRKKWAIFSMDEFLRFYQLGFEIRNNKFPQIKLLGSSVIDFEYYFSIRTLFNGYKMQYDQFSSLLYVDRRGAPENTQMGFNLVKKLLLLDAILRISPKSNGEIVITETNWPITGTYPYAPTSEEDCVSLEEQADYLVRYYLLALSSGVVKHVYWHQLIAPGYGLIDNRGDELIKYPSYFAFKFMIKMLQGAKLINISEREGFHRVTFIKNDESVDVLWSLKSKKLSEVIDLKDKTVISRDGKIMDTSSALLDGSPVYLFSTSYAS